jgi:branched-chain amino acid transport system substrate-binding protein
MPLYQRLVGIAIVNLSHFEHFGYAQSAFFGAKLAIKHINASAELRGRKFCLPEYVEEEESITSRRHPHWEKLVKHGRKFVIGHTWSACQASETYAKKGILMISPTTDPRLTTRGHKLLFRTVGTSDQQASVACDWIVRNIKRGTRIAVLSDMQDKTASAVRRGLKGKRKVVMVEEILPINYQDNSPTIRRMMQDRIEFVY